MRTCEPDELWQELDALAALAVERLVAAPAEARWRLLRRYSEKSRLCILVSALAQLGETRRRTVALNARIGSLQWSHRVEMEILRRGSPLPEEDPFRIEDPHPEQAEHPAVSDPPTDVRCPAPAE